jgi:uncharacterized protein YjaZ
MKSRLCLLLCGITIISLQGFKKDDQQYVKDYIIQKKNGQIILAYNAFVDFLDSDRSWINYKSILLDPYPSVQKVHNRQIEWGSVDTLNFPDQIKNYKKEDFEKFITQYDLTTINYLYDSVIEMSHKILPPVSKKEVDLCFFLPYGGCFVIPEDSLNTIFISMYINPDEAEKIMTHEYAHILHIDRRPKEPLTLKRELVSEGMAVFLTNLILKDIKVSNSIPFMPGRSFEWCMENEQMIRDSIKLELKDTTMNLFKRYIADGEGFAKPPKGFVEKTGYFIGYQIIKRCIDKGLQLEEICSFTSDEMIRESEYFKD